MPLVTRLNRTVAVDGFDFSHISGNYQAAILITTGLGWVKRMSLNSSLEFTSNVNLGWAGTTDFGSPAGGRVWRLWKGLEQDSWVA
jgi:hypothetical protein